MLDQVDGAFSDPSVGPNPRTGTHLFNLYHGSKTAPLCQGDALAQVGQVGQAGTVGLIESLVVLLQAPVGLLLVFMQPGKLASCLYNEDITNIEWSLGEKSQARYSFSLPSNPKQFM